MGIRSEAPAFTASMVVAACWVRGLLLVVLAASCKRPPAPTPTGTTSAQGTKLGLPPAPLPTPESPGTPAASFACSELPLLGVYRAAGAVREQSDRRLKLELRIDLHSLDCGAPESAGTTSWSS